MKRALCLMAVTALVQTFSSLFCLELPREIQAPNGHLRMDPVGGEKDLFRLQYFPIINDRHVGPEPATQHYLNAVYLNDVYQVNPPLKLGNYGDVSWIYFRPNQKAFFFINEAKAWGIGEVADIQPALRLLIPYVGDIPSLAIMRGDLCSGFLWGSANSVYDEMCLSNATISREDTLKKRNRGDYVTAPARGYIATHEIGHFISELLYGFWMICFAESDFSKIGWDHSLLSWRLKEDVRPASNYGHTAPHEDFAESFALYIYAPEELKEWSPERYNFMKDRIFHGDENILNRPGN